MEIIPTNEKLPIVNESEIQSIINATPEIESQALAVGKAIHDKPTAELAKTWIQCRKSEMDTVEGKFAVLKSFLHRSHKAVTDRIASLNGPREAGIKTVKAKLSAWVLEEDRKRRAEEERLAAEQRKRDEDQKLAAAAQLEKENPVLAEAILNSPVISTPPVLPPTKIEGMSVRKKWGVRCVNKRELIKGIAGGRVPEGAVQVDLKWLAAQAKLMDGNLQYPGVEVYEDSDVSIGSFRVA